MKIHKVDSNKKVKLHTKKSQELHIQKKTKKSGIKKKNTQLALKKNDVSSYHIGRKKKLKKGTIKNDNTEDSNNSSKKKDNKKVDKEIEKVSNKEHKKLKDSMVVSIGIAGVKNSVEQLEGGEEIEDAVNVAKDITEPVIDTISTTSSIFSEKAKAYKEKKMLSDSHNNDNFNRKERRYKRKKSDNSKESKNNSNSSKKSSKSNKGKKDSSKNDNTSKKSDKNTSSNANRIRKIQYFLDKMKSEEEQKDSIAKLAKELLMQKVSSAVSSITPYILMFLLVFVLLVVFIAVPVVAVISTLYNSPFAIFLPALEKGDSVSTVASSYVAEFNNEVNTLATEHNDADKGKIVYVDYEGTTEIPSNYYDILLVYMVKHGIGDTATVMNDKSKAWLKDVVDDMCSYTTEYKKVTEKDSEGNDIEVKYLYVNVNLKSYRDMIGVYGFDSEQIALLEEMYTPEYLSMLGWTGSSGGTDTSVGTLSEEEINNILAGITDIRLKTVCSFALHRVGYPYSQVKRDSGTHYDCSSLVYYAWKEAGVNISYEGSNTAASEAKGLDAAGKSVSYSQMQPGDLIFYSYTTNGRYKNISHVAMYVGNGKIVEARSEAYGVVYRDVPNVNKIVLIGRP